MQPRIQRSDPEFRAAQNLVESLAAGRLPYTALRTVKVFADAASRREEIDGSGQ
jgi:hypothetical protein